MRIALIWSKIWHVRISLPHEEAVLDVIVVPFVECRCVDKVNWSAEPDIEGHLGHVPNAAPTDERADMFEELRIRHRVNRIQVVHDFPQPWFEDLRFHVCPFHQVVADRDVVDVRIALHKFRHGADQYVLGVGDITGRGRGVLVFLRAPPAATAPPFVHAAAARAPVSRTVHHPV